jgi:hypothetical protein
MMSDRFSLNERIAALLRKGSPIPDAVGPSPAPSVDQPIFDEAVLEEGVIEGPIVGGDKLQALRNALAGNLGEPPLNSTNTEPSPPAFFDEESPVGTERALVDEAEQTDAAIARSAPTPAEQTPIDAPADAENLVIRAEQAKSLLAGLDLDTAIRLRWAMRDIRAKRTKLSPVSENDLAALIDLGFVEMREEQPRLTGLGVLALD